MRDNNERENTLVTRSCVRLDGWVRGLKFLILGLEIKFVENYFFLKSYGTSEGVVSHDVLYYQQLSITRHKYLCVHFALFGQKSNNNKNNNNKAYKQFEQVSKWLAFLFIWSKQVFNSG